MIKNVKLQRRTNGDGWKVTYKDEYMTNVTPYQYFSLALCNYAKLLWQSIWQNQNHR